jgi:hypothetical protein
MYWWVVPAITAGVGAYKGMEENKQAKKEQKAQAEVARWSPWTGMTPQKVDKGAGIFGGALQGGSSGLAMSQAMSKASAADGGGDASLTDGSDMAGEPTLMPEGQAVAYQNPQDPLSMQDPQDPQGMPNQQNPYGRNAWSGMSARGRTYNG